MRLEIRSRGVEVSERLKDHVEERLRLALGRLARYVGEVWVYLRDVNGPRGGKDKLCRVVMEVPRNGRVVVPLTREPRAMHAWKVVIPPERREPELRTHEGYEWLYVLSGELRLILAGHDVTMGAGEVAEFDTALPHWFGAAGDRPVEILSILSREGERIHVRAAPRRKGSGT